jgi:hypothetical protein
MAIFTKKKSAEVSKPVPVLYRTEILKGLMECFRIGSRIRFHREYEDTIIMESLVIGYCIEGQLIFQPKQILINDIDGETSITIQTKTATETYTRLSDFYLLLPADIDLESQLDTDSRAILGKRGPFIKGNFLKLMSFQPGNDNLSCEAIVNSSMKMTSGLHAGRSITQLEICIGTIDVFEPRCEARVNTLLPIKISSEESGEIIEAQMLDFSEAAIRIGLSNMNDKWPTYGKKNNPIISFTVPGTPAPMTLECKCTDVRGMERIFEIEKVKRQGQFLPFTDIDALELKINLLNAFED